MNYTRYTHFRTQSTKRQSLKHNHTLLPHGTQSLDTTRKQTKTPSKRTHAHAIDVQQELRTSATGGRDGGRGDTAHKGGKGTARGAVGALRHSVLGVRRENVTQHVCYEVRELWRQPAISSRTGHKRGSEAAVWHRQCDHEAGGRGAQSVRGPWRPPFKASCAGVCCQQTA